MSSKTAFERDNKSLRDLLTRERTTHAAQLKAKNDALTIAQALNPLNELTRSLPHLQDLITQLLRAHEASLVIRASMIDGPMTGKPVSPRDPYESGASTRSDRSRLEAIDRRLEQTADWITDLFGDRGPVEERAPQCGNPACPAHAWTQPYTAEVCGSCGLPFGKYHPKYSETRRRCKTRSCPRHGRIGECEHSLIGAGGTV